MKKKNELVPKEKMTMAEYEAKYSSKTNAKQASLLVNLVIALIGIFLIVCLFILFKEAYELHEYAGYAVLALGVILYILLFIVPVIRLKRMRKFEVDVTTYTMKKAKRHNERIKKELGDKIIELYLETTDSAGIYSSKSIEALINARKSNNKEEYNNAITNIYTNDVKKASKEIMKRCALKSALFSSLSQKDTTDALIVASINLQMIKDIIYLYGFRPSDTRLIKIMSTVLSNSLIAYGAGSISIGNKVVGSMSGVVKDIPLLGSLVSVLIDSSVQGLTNATLTLILGNQTIKYLMKEYNMQYILENIELTESEEEFINDCDEIKHELQEIKKNKSNKLVVAN